MTYEKMAKQFVQNNKFLKTILCSIYRNQIDSICSRVWRWRKKHRAYALKYLGTLFFLLGVSAELYYEARGLRARGYTHHLVLIELERWTAAEAVAADAVGDLAGCEAASPALPVELAIL